MASYTVKKDKWLVEVDFYDHSQCGGSNLLPMKCRIWGILWAEAEHYLHILTWCTNGNPDDDNSESYCVFKPAILKIKKLVKIKEI